jgi:uncharacterized repeat protein (TIGR01451 family)
VVTNPVTGCTSAATASVTQDITAPGANANGGMLNCTVSSIQLTASSTTTGVTFNWTGPNSFSSSQQNPSVNAAGTYTVTVTNPGNGCTSTAAAVVTQDITPPGITAIGGILTCTVTSVQLSATSSTSGVTYSWTGPNGFTSAQQNPTVSVAGMYIAMATNPLNGCTSTSTAPVSQDITAPGVTANGGMLNCIVNSIQLSASSSTTGVSYSWTGPNSFTSSQQNPSVNTAGTYTVTVTNTFNGCTSVATAVVTEDINAPSVTATGGALNCGANSVQLTATSSTSGLTYSWSGPNGFTSAQQNPTVTVPGTYTVIATNPANGCTGTATAVVTQSTSSMSCFLGSYTPYCGSSNNPLNVYPSGGTLPYTYAWTVNGNGWSISSGANSSQVMFNAGSSGSLGIFTVVVTDANGCSTTCSDTLGCSGNRSAPAPSEEVSMTALPNPFSAATTIDFVFNTTSADASVEIFSATGAKVATLYKGHVEQGKPYRVNFDASLYAEGIYFCRITANGIDRHLKLMLIQ